MKKRISIVFLAIIMTVFCLNAALAAEVSEQITGKTTIDNWTCKEVAELARKYGVDKKLPDAVISEGKDCPKNEVAGCLLSIIDKVIDKCGKEGSEAVPREDLDRIARLHEALKTELAGMEGYQTRRESIEKILAKPEEPPFLYKAGVKGFLRGEGAGNFRLPDFSYAPNHGEGRFLYRVKPYVYWHPTDYLDIHLEGQGYGFTGGSQYSGRYSLYQGFIEAKLPDKNTLALKVGRQEFSYGSTFILGSNSFYDGLAFDALRLRVQPADLLSIDILGGLYASPFSIGLGGNLTGVYATYNFSEGNGIEAYAFRDTGSVQHHHGEHLDIWGIRGTARLGPLAVEFEPVYESGKIFNPNTGANDSISAYGGHIDLTAGVELGGYNNKFVLGYALGSGDRNAAEGITFKNEFRNPDNDTTLVGDMSVIFDMSGITVNSHHASGLHLFTLGWGIDISKELNLTATGHYFLAHSVENGFSRGIGLETDFNLTYAINDDFSVIFAYDHFFTGGFFRDATGSRNDIHYGYVMLQFDLAKTKERRRKKG